MVDGKQRQTVKLSGLNVTDFSDAVVTSNPGKKLWNTGGSITLSDRPVFMVFLFKFLVEIQFNDAPSKNLLYCIYSS